MVMTGIDAELRCLPLGLRPEVGQYWEAFTAARATSLELPPTGCCQNIGPGLGRRRVRRRACIPRPALTGGVVGQRQAGAGPGTGRVPGTVGTTVGGGGRQRLNSGFCCAGSAAGK